MVKNPYLDALKEIPINREGFSYSGKYARNSLDIDWRIPSYQRAPFKDFRQPLVRDYSWAIPSDEALKKIVEFSRLIIEIGAGTGYWAYMLTQYGAQVRAFDMAVPGRKKNDWGHEKTWFNVEEGDALTVTQFPRHALMLCWPPYNDGMAEFVLQTYTGNKVIYIGEGQGGCTGTDNFHEILDSQWDEYDEVRIPQWDGIHDRLHLYTRKQR